VSKCGLSSLDFDTSETFPQPLQADARTTGHYLELAYDRFLPYHLQFIFSVVGIPFDVAVVWATDSVVKLVLNKK
jgi:hypothetical protein